MITAPHIIPYERKYRNAVLSLLFYARHVHSHLDWYQAGQWLDVEERFVRLAYDKDVVVGVIGVSHPIQHTAWIRLAAVRQRYDLGLVLGQIWQSLADELAQAHIHTISALVINNWIAAHLPQMGFDYAEDVVTLYRSGTNLPPPRQHTLRIRNAYLADLRAIAAVDNVAFAAAWQMSTTDLRYAQRQAASCTVAEDDSGIIGYQITTRHHTSAHLARLAVLPKMQGQGVGAAILDQLINSLNARGVRSITVNTQASNIRSQRLYQRYGFRHNGFDLPIWSRELSS